MTYQQQTAVVVTTTAHGSSLFYFSYAAAVMIMAVATVSSVEMMAADFPETIAHGSLLLYFFYAAVVTVIPVAAAVAANYHIYADGEPLGSPFFLHWHITVFLIYWQNVRLLFKL